MSKGKLEQELQALLADLEITPPQPLWPGILRKLHGPKFLLGGLAVILLGLASFSFWLQPKAEESKAPISNAFPDRIILMIDTSYCIDGSIRLDTVFQELTPTLPIKDTIPSGGAIAMREVDENWVIFDLDNPMYVDSTSYNNGKKLYINYCAACHNRNMRDDMTGPALAGVTARREQKWLYDYTRNSQKMVAEGDPQAVEIWENWQPTVMNNFPELKDEELHDIYYFVANVERGD